MNTLNNIEQIQNEMICRGIERKERHEALKEKIGDEIARRAISRPTGFEPRLLRIVEERDGQILAEASYWHRYSSRQNWHISVSYLYGCDESGPWVARVPSTCTDVDQAIDWMTPQAVKIALRKDLPTKRQGDIWFVGNPRGRQNLTALQDTRHTAEPRQKGAVTIKHPEHRALRLSGKYRWRAYLGRQDSGAGARRGD